MVDESISRVRVRGNEFSVRISDCTKRPVGKLRLDPRLMVKFWLGVFFFFFFFLESVTILIGVP